MNSEMPDRQSSIAAEVDAARVLLSRLGLRAEDLLETPVRRPAAPTFRDYIPIVAAGVRPGTRRVYGSYWNRIDKHWGDRRIDEPTPSQIRQLLVDMRSELVIRRSGRGGHSATERMIAALQCIAVEEVMRISTGPAGMSRMIPPTSRDARPTPS
jgi:integrase/recombinase XerC